MRVQVLEPIADRLDKSAELTQQASQAVMTLHKDLGTSIDTIQKFQKETLGELQKFAQNLGQTLSQFQTDTKGVLEQTALEINRAVNQSIEGMTAQRSAFEASADNAATSFRGIREELEAALRERAEIEQQMLQGVRDDIEQTINRTTITFQQQTNTLKTVGNQASGLMNEAKESLIATLGNIDNTLTTTRKTVQSDLTQFREEYQGNLQAFFTTQNNLLEGTLGKQRDGLAAVVTNLDTVFQHEATRRSELAKEVDNSMTTIHKAAEEVGKLAIATGLNSNQRLMQLQELARDINEQVQAVKREYRELSTTSKELSATFNHNLTAWKNHFENWQTKFFGEADNAMAKVWTNVLTTADVLVAAKNSGDNGGNQNG